MSYFSNEGFSSTWRKFNSPEHVTSPSHRAYTKEYLNLVVRHQQFDYDLKKWKAVTDRVIEVVSFLTISIDYSTYFDLKICHECFNVMLGERCII